MDCECKTLMIMQRERPPNGLSSIEQRRHRRGASRPAEAQMSWPRDRGPTLTGAGAVLVFIMSSALIAWFF